MSDKLDMALDELKKASGGKVTKAPLPDDALLKAYVKELGTSFSDDYRRFLKSASNVFYGTIEPLTVTERRDMRGELAGAVAEARQLGMPDGWLPICEDNGDYYCLLPSGEVRFWWRMA